MSKSKTITPGSIWIEIALWIIFFPAGIIYSLWRITNKRPAEVPVERRNRQVNTYITHNGRPPNVEPYHGDIWHCARHQRTYVWANGWSQLGEEA